MNNSDNDNTTENCFTHTNTTSFTFYNDFIIKSNIYKKLKCLCFHFVKFSFPIARSLDAHASICTLKSFICSRIKFVNLYTLHLFNYMN